MQGNYDESVSLSREALALFERLGDRRKMAGCHHNIATVAFHQGDLAAAEAGYRQAMEKIAAIGDERSRVMILGNIGVIAFERRDFETARNVQEESAETMRAMGDEIGFCSALGNLAGALNELGDTARATELTPAGAGNWGAARSQAQSRIHPVRSRAISSDRGEYADGAEHVAASLTAFHECGAPAEMAKCSGPSQKWPIPGRSGAWGAAVWRIPGHPRRNRHDHAPNQIEDYERVLGLVRAGAGDEAFEAAWAAGMAAPLDEIVRDAFR